MNTLQVCFLSCQRVCSETPVQDVRYGTPPGKEEMNQTSEGIGGVPGTIFELRNGIVGKPAPMAALFSFPAPCASGWKDLARTRECANKNRHPFSAPVEWLNKRQGGMSGTGKQGWAEFFSPPRRTKNSVRENSSPSIGRRC